MTDNNWADHGELDFFDKVSTDIESGKVKKINKLNEARIFIVELFNRMDLSFEPDPDYRDNVRNIIIGLTLYQLFKQRTISLFRAGKEDREYLASFLMYHIQKYLFANIKVTDWNTILTDVYNHFKEGIKFTDIGSVVVAKLNINKIIPENILLGIVASNKKEYTKVRRKDPPTHRVS